MSIGRRILFYNGLPALCQCAQQVFSHIGAGCQFQLLFQSKIGIGDDSQRKHKIVLANGIFSIGINRRFRHGVLPVNGIFLIE